MCRSRTRFIFFFTNTRILYATSEVVGIPPMFYSDERRGKKKSIPTLEAPQRVVILSSPVRGDVYGFNIFNSFAFFFTTLCACCKFHVSTGHQRPRKLPMSPSSRLSLRDFHSFSHSTRSLPRAFEK